MTAQTRIRLNIITAIEKYLIEEMNQRKSCSKKVSKYVTVFDYQIVLSATTGGVSIILFTSVVRAPVGIASASFTLFFSLTTGITKNLQSIARNKKNHPW